MHQSARRRLTLTKIVCIFLRSRKTDRIVGLPFFTPLLDKELRSLPDSVQAIEERQSDEKLLQGDQPAEVTSCPNRRLQLSKTNSF